MDEVQFIDVKPFVSYCKDFEVVFHIPSSIKASSEHWIALCELLGSNQFTWIWAGETVPLEQEGITVKWWKGKATFATHVLPKLSDGREYYLEYYNEAGTILGKSSPFQFYTEAEFSSLDLQSTPSDDVVMISMHGKKAPPSSIPSLEVFKHNISHDTTSFEAISEQTHFDAVEPIVDEENQWRKRLRQDFLGGEKEGEANHFSKNTTCTVVSKKYKSTTTTIEEGSPKGDVTSSYMQIKSYHHLPLKSNSNQENIQVLIRETEALKKLISELKDELTMKDNMMEDLQTENAILKEQLALHKLSNSTVLVNSPKEDEEKKILKKRIQDEAKKFSRLEELLDHKEANANDNAKLIAESSKIQQLLSQDYSTCMLARENQKLCDQLYKSDHEILSYQGTNEEYEVMVDNYNKFFCTLVDIDELVPNLVPKRIITMETSARIHKASTLSEKVSILMVECIAPLVRGGKVSVLYHLLDVMGTHGLDATQELAAEIRTHLKTKKRTNRRLLELQYQLKHGDLDTEERQLLEHSLLQLQHQVSLEYKREPYQQLSETIYNSTAEQEDAL